MASTISSRRVVLVSFVVDVVDVVTNLVVAVLTGSATVFSEMAQGVADATGSALLVIGERRSRRPRDPEHPLGHGREAFFWGLLSAVAMLVIGAGLSAWRGYRQLVEPEPLATPGLAVAVLGLAVATNSYAVRLSVRKLVAEQGSLRQAFRNPGRPLVKGALLRDVVGVSTSVLGLGALAGYLVWEAVFLDALGALLAAGMMAASSLVLMAQARELIVGRSLPASDLDRIRASLSGIPEVEVVSQVAAVFAGAREASVELDLDVAEGLDTAEIEALLDRVEAQVRRALPGAARVRIDLNSPSGTFGRQPAPPERR